MGKGSKRQKKDFGKPKEKTRDEYFREEDMDDEVDAFHKQRDVIPLDVDGDEGFGASDDDNEQPVFDFEDEDDDDDDDDSDDDEDDDTQLTGLGAKIVRQQKFLRQKIGGVEDELHDDVEGEDEKKAVWGRGKNMYYDADNVDYELQSSDEDLPAEEEAEVLRLQKEKAKSLSMEDFGLEDAEQDESDFDAEPKVLEDLLFKGTASVKPHASREVEDDTGTAYEEVKKDINSLSREEQMDVVYSSAPELVGLLSELNDALDELERKVNPLLRKVEESKTTGRGGLQYLKTKQLLLLTYCQSIGFYLLLKSEGHPVRDHPVIARLVEIKSLLEKVKQLDGNLPPEIEEFLNKTGGTDSGAKVMQDVALKSKPSTADHKLSPTSSAENQEVAMPRETTELVGVGFLKDHVNKAEKRKRQNDQVAVQSIEMLKVRARLEEKLKQKGVFKSVAPKPDRSKERLVQPVNRKLETLDDFDDEVIDKEAGAHGLNDGHTGLAHSMSKLVAANGKKSKVVSGDNDAPKRDDIGERRRKYERQVLSRVGVELMDDDLRNQEDDQAELDANFDDDDGEGGQSEGSEDEFYKQVKEQRAAKLSAKAELYGRAPKVPSLPETEVADGKRHITQQMEKNRGLTRARKKLIKNPRKKYRLKHRDAVVRRKGQVREVKKPTGPYGGEVSGINAGISRSIRFKN
ncbi:something about silencing protein 10 [Macadamia integrifolia]|uniref:something about silencing protein 10 n=1 Tax=Macadamia integrifolia TaxID=60698 RepID=UPI001C501A4D|nr:something about silencing protein 10 [Macadamia integrifolia]